MPTRVQPASLTAINIVRVHVLSPHHQPSAQHSFTVSYSSIAFGFFWAVFLLVHVVASIYYAVSAWIYFVLPTTFLSFNLEFYGIWLYQDKSVVIACIQVTFALIHIGSVFHAVWRFRKWRRHPLAASKSKGTLRIIRQQTLRFSSKVRQFVHTCRSTWMRHFSVSGKHFELVHLTREIVEIVMQSIQVHRMSASVPRRWLIAAMMIFLVLNCWSTPLASRVHAGNVARARFWSIFADCCLDVIVAIILPITIALPYLQMYDMDSQDLVFTVYYDEEWFVRMLHELPLLLIGSFWNLISSTFFSTTTLLGLRRLKAMLVVNSVHVIQQKSRRQISAPAQSTHRIQKSIHALVALWGLTLVLIGMTTQFEHSSSCTVQVRPWFHRRATCILMKVDCARSQVNDSSSAIIELLQTVDPSAVSALAVRNCPYVEIPQGIQDLKAMVMLNNSTIVRWDSTAALTDHFHPALMVAFFAIVNFTSFPEGLLSVDFPAKLTDIEFASTNLTTLPDAVADIWPPGLILVLEKSGVKEVPNAVIRLNVSCLSLCGNELQKLPVELFTPDLAVSRWLNVNPLSVLSDSNLQLSKGLKRIKLDNTNISALPSWIDKAYFERGGSIALGGSPFCDSWVAYNMSSEDPLHWMHEAYVNGLISCDAVVGDDLVYYPYEYEANRADDV